jgi:pimeloyl-ACP methyl ester carboxylesterase
MLRATRPSAQPTASDPPLRTVELATGPASYSDEGSGPVVVAIHGLPGSARDFRWLAPHLSARLRLLRIEMPGFGATPVRSGAELSPEGRARFVLSVLRALGVERPVLVGHSMGGVVAAAAVDLEPDAFAGLGLLATPGLRRHTMLRRVPFGALSALLARPRLGPALGPLLRRAFARAGFRGYPDSELDRTIHCVAHTPMAEHAARVRRLRLPTLLAWCQDDPIIQPDLASELAGACPAGPRLCFPSGGHNLQKTRAQEIGAALVAWAEGLS